MYNHETKTKYLTEHSFTYQREGLVIFNKFEPIENRKGKDLSQFTVGELLAAIEEVRPGNEKSAKVHASYISGYRKHILKDDNDIFKDVDPEFYNQFKPAQ